ncbi:hypothetical protein D9M70_501880 [compost metagenome]
MKMYFVSDWSGKEPLRTVQVIGKPDQHGYVATEIGPLHTGYLFPLHAKEQVETVLAERGKLRKAYDDSIALVYRLNNAYSGKKGFEAQPDLENIQ